MTDGRQPSTAADGPIERAFRLLQAVVAAGEPVGVRELGRRTGLPRSTASRLVATLERLRMVERTPSGEVVAGGALATLQLDTGATPLLKDQLHPLLVALVTTVGENAALSVDDGDELLYVSGVVGENPVSVDDITGQRQPFHLVAPGLVTMAYWPADRLEHYLSHPLVAATDHSMTDGDELRDRLNGIRRSGHAWTDQELDIGINGLAVPVVVDGELVATISVYGPAYRFSASERPGLPAIVRSLVDQRLHLG